MTPLVWIALLAGLLWARSLCAQPTPEPPIIPVWIYNADSFEFWRTPQGEMAGFYPELIRAINQKYRTQLQLQPISGPEIGQRFNTDSYGVYAGVLRTEARARSKILSSQLFNNEVVAASPSLSVNTAEELRNARVLFRQSDATLDSVQKRYPDLKFRSLRLVASSEEAFRLLSEHKADFYINDASEMENTQRYYLLSRPFPELRIPVVLGFSPELRDLREKVNAFIGEWYRSGKMRNALEESKRDYLLSRITISPEEQAWLASHRLQVWLPKNENFAPIIWKDSRGYQGTAINMIHDMRELLGMEVDVHFIDNYTEALQKQRWPIRMVDVAENRDTGHAAGRIGPDAAWHNVYYNRINQPFLWDEESIRSQRVGVLAGSFSGQYLQARFGNDVVIVEQRGINELIDAIDNNKIDYILGDLSSLESRLRGNELFRGVLKVAGVTRSEFVIGPWVEPDHPLFHLLTQAHRLSGFRTQLERSGDQEFFPALTKNTLKVISVVLLITALFSSGMLVMMRRHIKENRLVNRNIVQALEKVNRAHDDETGSHIQRVAKYCGMMARELNLSRKMISEIERFASLHDVGKIAVPDRILRKQGPLTEQEFSEMKLHTTKGYMIIQGLGLGPVAENIIHFHHEKWDGSGYPEGLRGENIPLEARILALADVYDALRQKRIYKPGFSHELACEVILDGTGKHFDPQLIALFRQHHLKFCMIFDSLAD
ncbi:HD domain-containing phosphohydrolase [Lelliottia sp. CFBP8978]|uniref:HD domain-containing phosphohydrolase n=1 Tax=Lelliottia sp. CFBP8978 TaxID=3096522 RepID=UPI002A69C90C|nr:HD domain-containing phosphohydrolase [Lelliottia sp. CFBP8978]MDY1039112.1 transporter substrate-binding domain-containing protein [Lelliottia sp. CFBP8978]